MNAPVPYPGGTAPICRLAIWHTEGTAISGLLSWMWRLKQSLPAAGIELTLASLELQPFRFPQVCEPERIYDVRLRSPQEFVAFLKQRQETIHLINHAYEYLDLLELLHPALLRRLTLVGICHTDQDFYYHHLQRLDSSMAGIVAVSPRCVERLEGLVPRRQGNIPVLPDWDMPVPDRPPERDYSATRPLRLLFNGRLLHLQKRVLDLPEISRRLAAARVPVELTVVGDGPDLPRLRDEFQRGPHIPVRLLPARTPWEMDDLLREHDVFLQVSEFEGASVSLMEAMMAGLVPVVTLTRSGTELLQQGINSTLCPVGDLDAIAGAIIDLQSDRDVLAHLSRAAFHTARVAIRELDYAFRLRAYLEQLRPAAAA